MKRSALLHLVVVLLALAGLVTISPAARGQTTAKPKLADELEDDLLKDLPGTAKTQKERKKAPPAAAKEGEKKLLQDLEGEDIGAPPENPLARIGQRMRAVEELIAGRDTSQKTQDAEKEILSDLARLIEQTKKQCQGGSGKPGQGKSSAKVGAGNGDARGGLTKDSTDRVGQPNLEKTETADVKDVLRRIWGQLPEKMRDEMQAQFSEQFLPKYEKLIEEYYKRLAEERP